MIASTLKVASAEGTAIPLDALTIRGVERRQMAEQEIPQIVRAFKFRLLPTKAQHRALTEICESQRILYNAALQERIDCYRKAGKSIGYFTQCGSLTICRRDDPAMAALPLSIQRATIRRLDEAFNGFFRRVKAHKGKAGFPRFKGKDWWSGFGFRGSDGLRFDGKHIRFSTLPGAMRVHMHRIIPKGDIIGCSFKRTTKGWQVSFQILHDATSLAETGSQIGIDVGLLSFAALSTGETIPNPRHAKRVEREMRRRQRALARCKRGSNNRRKVKLRLTRLHTKLANSRDTYLHQVAARLVRENDLIAVEDLNVRGLASGMLAKSVNDAAWAKFRFHLCAKAERAGRTIVAVDPRYTSQTCPDCGAIAKKDLSERDHRCPCGCTLDRDVAAARVILHRAVMRPGLAKLPRVAA